MWRGTTRNGHSATSVSTATTPRASAPAPAPIEYHMTEPAASVRVLVADDDGDGRALLVKTLSSLGHEVVAEVESGREAVALAQVHAPDVVVLDVHMPGVSGIEAAKQIATASPGTAVLLVTGDDTLRLSELDVLETAAISILPKGTRRKMLDSALRLAVARAAIA